MEVMPAEPFPCGNQPAFGAAIHGDKAKNPAEWPGRGPETRSYSGRGDAAEGPLMPIRSRVLSSVRACIFI
jgi:hypothetical protein